MYVGGVHYDISLTADGHFYAAMHTLPYMYNDGKVLEEVSSYRYLGIVVTPSLSWKSHINQIIM